MAEKEGFEPSIPFWGIHDFQSCALGQLRDFSKCAVQSAKTYYRIFMKMSSIIFTIYKKIFQLFPTLVLDFVMKIHYNIKTIGVWRSLVSRLVRVQEASGSNPDTPTTITGIHLCGFRLFFAKCYFISKSISSYI